MSLAENNLFNFQDRHGVLSVKQLVRYLNLYRKHKNIMAIVSDIYQSRLSKIKDQTSVRKRQCLDDAIETTFHIYIVTGFNLMFQKRYAWWIVCNDMYVSKII